MRGRAKRAAPGAEPATVEVTRATVITTDPLPEDGAAAWLDAAVRDRDATVGDALALLNRTIHGHRLAARDPYVAEVSAGQALATRIGYGSGEQVADGDWEAARELPRPKPPRSMLHPQQRLAALLSGRDVALACEELALRARLDLDQGREREAALQLSPALGAALAELEGGAGRTRSRAASTSSTGTANRSTPPPAAREGGLQSEHRGGRGGAGRLEAALRARIASL